MSKIVFINAVSYGSTAKIINNISDELQKEGHKTYIFNGWTKRKSKNTNVITGSFLSKLIHIILAKMTGYSGCFSYLWTKKMIRKIKKIKPNCINLHLLHSWSFNLPLLFKYLKKSNVKILWTMHDCWAFTGQCPYFTLSKCNKWVNGCYECNKYKEFNSVFFDRTKKMWSLKKKWFNGVPNLTIISPSVWLSDLIKESFLGNYNVKVINNGIDIDVFKPVLDETKIDSFSILGVSFDWSKRKGLDAFIKLADDLPSDIEIVLVGTNDEIDKMLPTRIKSIHRTANQIELAKIYSKAKLFINPTLEDNYPTVLMESLACGTPAITYNTGGCKEIVSDSILGNVIEYDDYNSLKNAILENYKHYRFDRMSIRNYSLRFDSNLKYKEYIEIMVNDNDN